MARHRYPRRLVVAVAHGGDHNEDTLILEDSDWAWHPDGAAMVPGVILKSQLYRDTLVPILSMNPPQGFGTRVSRNNEQRTTKFTW